MQSLGEVPGLSIMTQAIKAFDNSSQSGSLFPPATDGITLLAPSDAAFISLFNSSGLTAAELGDKVMLQMDCLPRCCELKQCLCSQSRA